MMKSISVLPRISFTAMTPMPSCESRKLKKVVVLEGVLRVLAHLERAVASSE